MPFPVVLAFAVLVLAAGLMAGEVWAGRPVGVRRAGRIGAAVVFGTSGIAGATLLTALAGGEWLLALTLVPLTTLSIVRFGGLVLPDAAVWKRAALVGVVLAVGVVGALQVVPIPLTRVHLLGGAVAPSVDRPTARPYSGRPVRG